MVMLWAFEERYSDLGYQWGRSSVCHLLLLQIYAVLSIQISHITWISATTRPGKCHGDGWNLCLGVSVSVGGSGGVDWKYRCAFLRRHVWVTLGGFANGFKDEICQEHPSSIYLSNRLELFVVVSGRIVGYAGCQHLHAESFGVVLWNRASGFEIDLW